jgi:hypothetical protein
LRLAELTLNATATHAEETGNAVHLDANAEAIRADTGVTARAGRLAHMSGSSESMRSTCLRGARGVQSSTHTRLERAEDEGVVDEGVQAQR